MHSRFFRYLQPWLRALPLSAAAFAAGWYLRPAPAPGTAQQVRVVRSATAGEATAAGQKPAVAETPRAPVFHLLEAAARMDARQTLSALHALDLQRDSPHTRLAREIYLAQFGTTDPLTALTYVDTLPADERAAASAVVMDAWAARDPHAAAAHLENQSSGFGLTEESAAEAAGHVAATWAASDPAAARAWVQGLDEDLRAEALPALADTMALKDPASAAAWAASLSSSEDQAAAVEAVAGQWAVSSPQNAAAWVSALTNDDVRAAATGGLVHTWMASDPAAASRWVDSLPRGAARDHAILALASSPAIRNDAASAAAWAATIQDPTLRDSALPGLLLRRQYQLSAP